MVLHSAQFKGLDAIARKLGTFQGACHGFGRLVVV
jgi:hypothetical protein